VVSKCCTRRKWALTLSFWRLLVLRGAVVAREVDVDPVGFGERQHLQRVTPREVICADVPLPQRLVPHPERLIDSALLALVGLQRHKGLHTRHTNVEHVPMVHA